MSVSMQEMAREMERTTFVRKVITDLSAPEVLRRAQEWFKSQGYRAGKGGSPNTVRLMGKSEGVLPSVIGEIGVRTTNKGRTIVSLSGYGEQLQERLKDFHDQMRAARLPRETRPAVAIQPRPETRTEQLEEEMLEAAEVAGTDIVFNREKYEGGQPQ